MPTATNPLDDTRELFAVVTPRCYGEFGNDRVIGPYSTFDPDASDDEAADWLRDVLEEQGDLVGRVWVAREPSC